MLPPETTRPDPGPPRKMLGRGMIVFGLIVIFVSVIYVLEVANGPGTGPKSFAQRRSYNQVKEAVHASYPMAFVVAMVGLGVAIAGARMSAEPEQKEPNS